MSLLQFFNKLSIKVVEPSEWNAVEEKQPPFITNYRPASDVELLHITLKPLYKWSVL